LGATQTATIAGAITQPRFFRIVRGALGGAGQRARSFSNCASDEPFALGPPSDALGHSPPAPGGDGRTYRSNDGLRPRRPAPGALIEGNPAAVRGPRGRPSSRRASRQSSASTTKRHPARSLLNLAPARSAYSLTQSHASVCFGWPGHLGSHAPLPLIFSLHADRQSNQLARDQRCVSAFDVATGDFSEVFQPAPFLPAARRATCSVRAVHPPAQIRAES